MGFARDKYLPTVLPTLAPTTQNTVRREVAELCETFGRHILADINAEQVEAWWADLRGKAKPRAGRSDNMVLIRLQRMFVAAIRWGLRSGNGSGNPAAGCKRARESKGRVAYFKEPAIRAAILEGATNTTLRDFLTIAHYTAARGRQVWSLEARDIDLERGVITFRNPKGSEHDLRVPIHPALAPVLLARTRAHPEGRLFPAWTRPGAATCAWIRLRQSRGLGDFRLHDWRHDTSAGCHGHGQSGGCAAVGWACVACDDQPLRAPGG